MSCVSNSSTNATGREQRRALWVFALLLGLAPLVGWSLTRIDLHNNVETWLPDSDPDRQLLTWYLDRFGHDDSFVISWDNSSLHDPRVPRLAARLEGVVDQQGVRRGGLKQIQSVVTPHELIAQIAGRGVSVDEAVRRAQGLLVGTGPLKVRLTAVGRARRKTTERLIRERLKAQLGLDVQILGPVEPWIPPEGYFEQADRDRLEQSEAVRAASELEARLPNVPPHDLQIRWAGMRAGTEAAARVIEVVRSLRAEPLSGQSEGEPLVEDCFFAPGSPVGLLVTLSEAGAADVAGTLAEIRRIASEVGVPAEQLHMGGPPVATCELNRTMGRAVWNPQVPLWDVFHRSPILLSALVGTALAFVLLNSVRLAVLVLAMTYYAVLATAALVPATGTAFNMVLVVMPTLLLAVTLSAAIHLVNYWKHAWRSPCSDPVGAATRLARRPCTLASLTTAIGLLSLLTSTLRPVREFGVFSAVGCLISLVLVLVGLPGFLRLFASRPPAESGSEHEGWQRAGDWLARARWPVLVGSVAVFAVCCYGLRWFRTETKVIRYFPSDSRLVQDYRFLEENLSYIVPVAVLVRFDKSAQEQTNFLERVEIVRQIEEGMRRHAEISGTLSLADFLKKYQPPSEKASRIQKLLAARKANETERRVKEGRVPEAARFLRVADRDATFVFGADETFRVRKGDEVWRILAQASILSDFDYAQLANHRQTGDLDEIAKSSLKYYAGADHVVTGMVPVFLNTQRAVLVSLIKSFALAFAVIAVVLMVILRNPVAGLLAMLPNLMPVGVVFGLLAWNGLAVDIGTMVTASVALGMAVDGTLHLATWFQERLRSGATRHEAAAQALARCGPALWQTTLIISAGMFMLFPAELLLVSRFGWLMAALILAAFFGDAVVLTALLAGPLGAVIEKLEKESANGETPGGEERHEAGPQAPSQTSGAVEGPVSDQPEPVPPTPHMLSAPPTRNRPTSTW